MVSIEDLESKNSSIILIFRLPSSSVTMCEMVINSKVASTPILDFVLAVIYGVNTTLDTRSADAKVLDTDVGDHFSWNLYHGMKGCLWEGFNRCEGVLRSSRHDSPRFRSKVRRPSRDVRWTPLCFPPAYREIAGRRSCESPCARVW